MKKAILIITLLVSTTCGFSQSGGGNLSERDLDLMMAEIESKVVTFTSYVQNLAGNDFSHDEKMSQYEKALDLFIGKGERYEIQIPTRNDLEWHEAVKMSVYPSKRNKNYRKDSPMKAYLYKLIKNSEDPNYVYKKVVIEAAEAIRIDNIQKMGPDKYIATAHYLQKQSNYRSADIKNATYTDYTSKTVTVYIDVLEMPGDDTPHFIIELGDVDCDDVW